jgi:uncharacterized phage infection (PIP) family protein YhgE
MNLKRLIDIAQEADKNGDYVTADKVTNLLKTAQGQYSVYPNQAAYFRTPQKSQQMPQMNQQMPQMNQQMPQMNQQMPQMNQQMPQMNQQMPQMNQQMPQQGGVYNPGIAPGATIYTPGVVNVAQPQMTDEQKAFADLRGSGVYQSLPRSRGVMDQRLQAQADAENKARQSRINYGPAARPFYPEGTDTSAPYQANPNAPVNPNLYGTGYASKAMQPQQPQSPQTPQQQAPPQQQYPYNQRRNPNS